MQNPWHTNLKKNKKKICEVEPWLTRHMYDYDYLGGHKDFMRLIFVRAIIIEKLQILAFHQSFSIYILYTCIYCKQGDLLIFFQSAQ